MPLETGGEAIGGAIALELGNAVGEGPEDGKRNRRGGK